MLKKEEKTWGRWEIDDDYLDEDSDKNPDSYMVAEMSRYYEEAKRLLAENMEFLKSTRDLPIEKKVVTGDEIRQLKEYV